MRRIFRKIAKNSLELVGRFYVGDTVLEVAVDNNLIIGLVNGYRIVDGQLADDPVDRITGTLANIAAKLVRDSWGEDGIDGAIEIKSSEWDSAGKYPSERYMKAMLTKLREAMEDNVVKLICDNEKSEPIQEQKTQKQIKIDLRQLLNNLELYNKKVGECLKCSDRALERASILLSKKVSSTMWGADRLQSSLDSVAAQLPALVASLENSSKACALGNKAIQGIVPRIRKGIASDPDALKYMKMILIPEIMNSQETLLSFVGSIVPALSNLSNLDRIVRSTTGYPASFMFKTSILDDLNEAYTVLVSFLSDIPSMERDIFEPLEYIQHGSLSK